ncbi:MAG: DNRLRE domain-containing protein [Anaerostipes sp.]
MVVKKNATTEGITFYDKETEDIVAAMEAPSMNDAGEEAYSEALTYDVKKVDGEEDTYILTLTIDEDYLNDKNRQYPITIDPTVTWTGSSRQWDAYVINGSYKNSNFYDSGITVMMAGDAKQGLYRTYLRFLDFTKTVKGKYVQSATLSMYETGNSQSGQTIEARQVKEEWKRASLTWSNRPGYGTNYGSVKTTGTTHKKRDINVLNYARTCANGSASVYGLMLKNADETKSYGQFYSSRYSNASYRPKLSVTYYDGPTTATSASVTPGYVGKNQSSIKASWAGISSKSLNRVEYRLATWVNGAEGNSNYVPYSSSTKIGTTASGSANINCSSWAEGSYKLVIRGVDNGGINGVGKGAWFTIDRTNPVISSVSLEGGKTEDTPSSNSNPTLTWKVTEKNPSKVQYKVGSGSYVNAGTTNDGSVKIAESNFKDTGAYKITVKAQDQAGNSVEKEVTYYYIDQSKASEYQPTNPKVTMSYGKAVISWTQKQEQLPGSIYYEVYRGETADFAMNTASLVRSGCKDTYCNDMQVGDGKGYYYKVRAVKLAKTGTVLETGDAVTTQKITKDASTEYEKFLGSKDYRDTVAITTPNGSGTIDKASGNLLYTADDVELPVGDLSMSLTRTYNSQTNQIGMLGYGWSDTFHKQLYQVGNDIVFRDSDGTTLTFEKDGDSYVSKESKDYTLELSPNSNTKIIDNVNVSSTVGTKMATVNSGSKSILGAASSVVSTFKPSNKGSAAGESGEIVTNESMKDITIASTLTDKNENVMMFDADGNLTGMKHPNGDYVLYEYDGKGRVRSVTSNKNQTLTMEYGSEGSSEETFLKKIILPDHTAISYTYEDGNLATMTHTSADGNRKVTYEYSYNGNHQITGIKDAKGNIYSVSYTGSQATKFTKPNGEYEEVTYESGKTTAASYNKNHKKLAQDSIEYEVSTGKMTSSTNANGVTTSYQYGASNPLLQTGTQTTVYYQGLKDNGSVGFYTDAKVTTSTSYDANENVTKETDETGQVTTTAYTDATNPNLPTMEETKDGDETIAKTTSSYDEKGNITDETDAVGKTKTEYIYENLNDANEEEDIELTKETQYEEGKEVSTTTTNYGDVGYHPEETVEVDQKGIKENDETKYDSMGRVTSTVSTDATTGKETITTTAYDFLGRVTSTTTKEADGREKTETKSYDDNGAIKEETSATGVRTEYDYDEVNRVTSATETADGKSSTTATTYGYEDATIQTLGTEKSYENLSVTTVTVDGKLSSKTYVDGSGNTLRSLSGGIYTDHVFTTDGKEIATITLGISTSGSKKISMSLFDKEGKQTHTIQNPVVTTDGAASVGDATIVTETEYDAKGNESKTTDAKGNKTSYTYDPQNRIERVTQGDVTTGIAYTMAEDGTSTTSITDANGNINEEVSNAAGLTEKTTSREGKVLGKSISTVSTYDASGNKTRDTYESGAYEAYSYDDNNRLVKSQSFTGDGEETLRTTYTYDSNDQILESVDANVSGDVVTPYLYTTYSYDSRGKVLTYGQIQKASTPSEAEISAASIHYTYDGEGKLIKVAYPTKKNGVQGLIYQYNSDGWLIKILATVVSGSTQKEQTLRTYSYDSYGKVSEIKDYCDILGTGQKAVKKTYTYDAFDRVKEMVYTDLEHPDTVMESYSYSYDKNSNITKKTQINNYPSKTEEKVNETKEYTYDTLNRLTKSVSTNHQKNDAKTTNTYVYDGVGNRLSEDIDGTKTSYDYNGLDQVKTATTAKGTAVDEVKQYDYDVNGNEVEQSSTKTGQTIKRTYDTKNQLSTVSTAKNESSTLVQTNAYNGDGQRIQKIEGSNVANYYYQDGVVSSTTDGTGAQTCQNLIGLEGNIIGTQRYASDTTSYYSYNKDIQGSTTSLIKEDGTADATYMYTDFGETTTSGNNTVKNEVCYTGGIYDSSTGQYYLNARYYNPEDGRFLTEDTYRGESNQPDTQNLYAYCAGNPVNYVDPSGHKYYMESNVRALRVCTDGKIANKDEAKREKNKNNGPYGDKNHQKETRGFEREIAADQIPYIVVPTNQSKYMLSVGVIINRNTKDYLYCVVAEYGSKKNGMGEVSIYAAWKMREMGIPSMNKKVSKKKRIANQSQKGSWKIIVYKKSAPNAKKYRCGWEHKNGSKLRSQIKRIGKKFYKGGRKGKCLN